MMPFCGYEQCKQVSDESIGNLKHPGKVDYFGKPYTEPLYLCAKHAKKIRKALHIPEEEQPTKPEKGTE